jgi:predicted nucleic-acid-binding Zn-ribbon protein
VKRYSEQSTCPKCGNIGLLTRYHNGEMQFDEKGNKLSDIAPYMGRECLRCGYGWKEAPLDMHEDGKDAPFKCIVLPDNWNMYRPTNRRDVNPSRGFQLTGHYCKESKCPKCGNTTLTGTRYLDQIVDDDGHTFTLSAPVIERDCARCGYIRFELPLDTTEEEVHAILKGPPMPGLYDSEPEEIATEPEQEKKV